jgi:isopentenyl-diphosphate Delta-isomerase
MHSEHLILVNEANRPVGRAPKMTTHEAGLLHRAFSVFLSDPEGRILLQQRHPAKYHSGGLWANSCCGHPRIGERTKAAARRRVMEELGVGPDLRFAFRTRYSVTLENGLRENELVYVFFGELNETPQPDAGEVAGLSLASLPDVMAQVQRAPNAFAYWFRHYMENHRDEIAAGVQRTVAAGASRMTRSNLQATSALPT